MRIARTIAEQSTCARRAVGAVGLDARGHVLAIGYNGNPPGDKHCNEGAPCQGVGFPSGTGLNLCAAIHAEVNMLAQCRDVYALDAVYLTVSPCVPCVKALLATSTRTLYVGEIYPGHEASLDRWRALGRHAHIIQVPE
jgi:dCMP deaminase